MRYADQLREYEKRRSKIIGMYTAGKPRSVIARILGITRQRVYQLTAHIKQRAAR